ncbi:MAG: precorrin-6y C5,15-methyltransferase (decarboxylating) subunit CbiE [Gordonia sp. (in: high G+C Gram-positive bacteria)]|uniref:precorrin-6y C5,15-methyltransferase (decarboxylating) subunit CbiE n=1 Tax=Gordonia sp. (in: high G+C Gram-positive bacteria) TaxID=84139 RepID=UPI0039E24DB6
MTHFVVVGIGADGWDGLSGHAQAELRSAEHVYGSARQLAMLPDGIGAETTAWSSPMSAHLDRVLADDSTETVHLLASGDPMFHGLAASVVRAIGADRVTVFGASSSVSLAAARLGWDLARTEVRSLVTGEVESLVPALTDGARILVLSRDGDSPRRVADLLRRKDFGWSTLTVLGDLGGVDESVTTGLARSWDLDEAPALNIVAVECVGPARTRAPGRPDADYAHDGQLTKQPFRALTVCALAPAEGQLLWDVGAGSGSIAIEWLRQTRTGRAIAFEADPVRAERIAANAREHGVAERLTVAGAAPEALRAVPDPDTVFIGGGLDAELLDTCWDALDGGGLLVANAVTLESERLLVAAREERGGDLIRVSVERAGALGSMTAWRPALPVVQWTVTR